MEKIKEILAIFLALLGQMKFFLRQDFLRHGYCIEHRYIDICSIVINVEILRERRCITGKEMYYEGFIECEFFYGDF